MLTLSHQGLRLIALTLLSVDKSALQCKKKGMLFEGGQGLMRVGRERGVQQTIFGFQMLPGAVV